jgi:CRISPR/Cas system-associated endonuclease Cas1
MNAHGKQSLMDKRLPMWLPYLQSIKETKRGVFEFVFNGGVETRSLDEIRSIMVYGDADCDLDVKIIDKIVRAGIPIIIHRRNMSQPIYITGGERADPENTIFYQMEAEGEARKTAHIARQILQAKFRSMNYILPEPRLPQFASVDKMRNIEAVHARKYWEQYFAALGHAEWTRRGHNPAAAALDASSKFVSGIVLRWVTYHHLSPFHGFLHQPHDYPSLVYDLMEPTRGLIEKRLLVFWKNGGVKPENYLTAGIAELKDWLDEKVYVPLTRQIVTNHELLHGSVLSLKYYLLKKQRKFLIPLPGRPNGGRPPKVNFLLYGRHAGRTDFWNEVRKLQADEMSDAKTS